MGYDYATGQTHSVIYKTDTGGEVCAVPAECEALAEALVEWFNGTTIPEHIWEVTYRLPNGDDRWYRTSPMPFDRVCFAALHDTPDGARLIRIEKVPTTVVNPNNGVLPSGRNPKDEVK